MISDVTIYFKENWVDERGFEESLSKAVPEPHQEDISKVSFHVPKNCKIMIDSGIRLLSLAKQLNHVGKEVTLIFEEGEDGTMGYLDRIGFFEHLNEEIMVLPDRPYFSGAKVFRGFNEGLVEIAGINPGHQDPEVPGRLSDVLVKNISHIEDSDMLETATYTVFAELIDNIFRHSSTELDGFAALQVYKNGGRAKVVVSDSGMGILETLKPVLNQNNSRFKRRSDTDLIVEAFSNGLSRFGKGNGCGLKMCATQAMKFKAELDVRLPNSRVHLLPSPNGYVPAMAYCYDAIPLIWGTHICFDFFLDR
ncbi:MAG: sensor histidine kinase [Deltaproteobacteria bacterium]|nr:sensor histidine kinase [Deltaproteobacteria bacterium]